MYYLPSWIMDNIYYSRDGSMVAITIDVVH